MTGMITLYLRKESRPFTIDGKTYQFPVVAAYRDSKATDLKTVIRTGKLPDRRNKYIMFNCYRWRVEWLPSQTTDR